MNNHGVHTITFIFNLALTLHTLRERIFLLAFVVLKIAPAILVCFFETHEMGKRRLRRRKFSSTSLFFYSAQKFFFPLQRKLLITCNVITLRKLSHKMGAQQQQSIKKKIDQRREHQAWNYCFFRSFFFHVRLRV